MRFPGRMDEIVVLLQDDAGDAFRLQGLGDGGRGLRFAAPGLPGHCEGVLALRGFDFGQQGGDDLGRRPAMVLFYDDGVSAHTVMARPVLVCWGLYHIKCERR